MDSLSSLTASKEKQKSLHVESAPLTTEASSLSVYEPMSEKKENTFSSEDRAFRVEDAQMGAELQAELSDVQYSESIGQLPDTVELQAAKSLSVVQSPEQLLDELKKNKSMFSSDIYIDVMKKLSDYISVKESGGDAKAAAMAAVDACMRYDMTRGGKRSTKKGIIRKKIIEQVGTLLRSSENLGETDFQSEEDLKKQLLKDNPDFGSLSDKEQQKEIQKLRVKNAGDFRDVRRVMELLSEGGDSELYGGMNDALRKLTENYYNVIPDNKEAFLEQTTLMRKELGAALSAAYNYLDARGRNTSAKAIRRNETARQLAELLKSDMEKLANVDVNALFERVKTSRMSWADIVREECRYETLNVNEYTSQEVRGSLSVRQILTKDGKSQVVTPQREAYAFRKYIAELFPGDDPVMVQLRAAMEKKEFNLEEDEDGSCRVSLLYRYIVNKGSFTPKEFQSKMMSFLKEHGVKAVNKSNIEQVIQVLTSKIKGKEDADNLIDKYMDLLLKEEAGMDESRSPDFRSVAMSTMARLIKTENLIANTKFVEINGKKSISMEMVEGIDLNRIMNENGTFRFDLTDEQAAKIKNREFSSLADMGKLYADSCRLQVLDLLCAQADRHLGNIILEVKDEEGNVVKSDANETKTVHSFGSFKGIDNDLCFGTIDNLSGEMGSSVKLSKLYTLQYIDSNTYGMVMALTPEILRYEIGPYLTYPEMKALESRLSQVKEYMRKLEKMGRVLPPYEEEEGKRAWTERADKRWATNERIKGSFQKKDYFYRLTSIIKEFRSELKEEKRRIEEGNGV